MYAVTQYCVCMYLIFTNTVQNLHVQDVCILEPQMWFELHDMPKIKN